MSDVTQLLSAIDRGDPKAAEELLPLVYEELRRLAAAKMAREAPGHTLQPTALVHEAWLRLAGTQEWGGRGHFFSAAAEAMRRALVDRARRKLRLKHGGDCERLGWDELAIAAPAEDEKLLRVNEALEVLAKTHPEAAEVVKLRYFAGMGGAEIAATLGVSVKTVQRLWEVAKARMFQRLRSDA